AKDGSGDPPSPGRNGERGTRPVQGLLERLTLGLGHLGAAASGRRQARDDFRFPLNHLGIRARLTLRKHLLDKLNRPLNLLVRHRLDAAGMLNSKISRAQQCQQLAVSCRLVLAHLSNCRWTAVPEVSEQGRNNLPVQLLTVTRADRTAGRVCYTSRCRSSASCIGGNWRPDRRRARREARRPWCR